MQVKANSFFWNQNAIQRRWGRWRCVRWRTLSSDGQVMVERRVDATYADKIAHTFISQKGSSDSFWQKRAPRFQFSTCCCRFSFEQKLGTSHIADKTPMLIYFLGSWIWGWTLSLIPPLAMNPYMNYVMYFWCILDILQICDTRTCGNADRGLMFCVSSLSSLCAVSAPICVPLRFVRGNHVHLLVATQLCAIQMNCSSTD